MVVAGDAYSIDHANAELARDDRRRHQAATGDCDYGVKRPDLIQPPRQRAAIPVKLVPRDGKRFAGLVLRAQFRMLRHSGSPNSCPRPRFVTGPRSNPPASPL